MHHPPYLLVGFAADAQHFFALDLQLPGQSVDGLIQTVDLMVQVGDAVAAGTNLRLQVRDASQELLFLEGTRVNGAQHKGNLLGWRMLARPHASYLLVAVLHRVLKLSFGGSVFFKVDLLEMFYGIRVEVVEFCTERCCQRNTSGLICQKVSFLAFNP